MATKEKKQGKKREVQQQVQGAHAGKDLPVPPPRLRVYYEKTVRDRLMSQFGFTNVHQIPTLEKIVVNCGVGEAIKNPKVLDTVVFELSIIMLALLRWQLTLAEFVGAPLMVVLLVVLFQTFLTQDLLEKAKIQAGKGVAGRMEGHAEMDMSVIEGGSLGSG